ncbi:MAG: response regulator [Candidatus Riflebacteria bacterium]|nr:response regulator [Candidatus Riflebacteria bacterium]
MNNISIGKKMLLIGILIVITASFIAHTGITRLKFAADGFETISEKTFPRLILVSDTELELLEMIRTEKNLLLSELDIDVSKYCGEMNRLNARISELIEKLKNTSAVHEVEVIDSFTKEFQKIVDNQSEFLALASEKSLFKARTHYVNEASDKLLKIDSLIRKAFDSGASESEPLTIASLSLVLADINHLHSIIYEHLVLRDEKKVCNHITQQDILKNKIKSELDDLSRYSGNNAKLLLTHSTIIFADYCSVLTSVLAMCAGNAEQKARILSNEFRRKSYIECQLILNKLKAHYSEEMETVRNNQKKSVDFASLNITFSAFLGCGVLLLLLFIIVKSFVPPIYEMLKIASGVAQGEISVKLDLQRTDEIGLLAESLNRMIESLQAIVQHAISISDGNYDGKLQLHSKNDQLGIAIGKMIGSLTKFRNEANKRNWMETSTSRIIELIQGVQDLPTLGNLILSGIAEATGSQIGAFHLLQSDGTYLMVSSFAFDCRKAMSASTKPGEKIIGQAVLEKKLLVISDLPSDYIFIQSGLGESTPKFLVIVPCIREGEVKCVIELGTFSFPDKMKTTFLQRIQVYVAIAVHDIQSRMALSKLLEEQKKLTHEMEIQKEEMKQTNEQLEQQTINLKQSEEVLQFQQSELQRTNNELEERANLIERKKAEIEKQNLALEKANQEINAKAEELETINTYKSEFLANVSHELRTPLNSLLILSQLLIENKEKNLTEKQIEFVNVINSSGRDLLTLINDILDLTKVEAGKLRLNVGEVRLNDVKEILEGVFKPLADQKHLNFNINCSDVPDIIVTDCQRLEQVLKNLVSNAIKFTESGEVSIEILKATEEQILKAGLKMPEKSHSEMIAFNVRDTGIGIPEDKQKIVFDAFQQADGSTSRKYGGTGLGLTIARELVAILCGGILLESVPGKGSKFSVIIPTEIPRTEYKTIDLQKKSHAIASQENKSISSNSEKSPVTTKNTVENLVYIVEDDKMFSSLLMEVAIEKSFKVECAFSGKEALEKLNVQIPQAIILDMTLPDMTGSEFLQKAKELYELNQTAVHVVSAKDPDDDPILSDIVGWKTKPASKDSLAEIFNSVQIGMNKPFKNVIFVSDGNTFDSKEVELVEMLRNFPIKLSVKKSLNEAFDSSKSEPVDVFVLSIDPSENSNIEKIRNFRENSADTSIPIIIYTHKHLENKDELLLKKYADSIVIDGPKSSERLEDEVNLFLHALRRKNKNAVPVNSLSEEENETFFRGRKILVVDDDMRNVFALTGIFEQKGVKVIAAPTGGEAIKILRSDPGIDLILMDIMMPEMDGYETIRNIRSDEKLSEIPIIALTAKAMKGDSTKCFDAGANDYLSKPVDVTKLVSIARLWISEKRKN